MKKMKPLAFKKFKPQKFNPHNSQLIIGNYKPRGDVVKLVSTATQVAMGIAVMGATLDAVGKLKK